MIRHPFDRLAPATVSARLHDHGLQHWAAPVAAAVAEALQPQRHGTLPEWRRLLGELPYIADISATLDTPVVTLTAGKALAEADQKALRRVLEGLIPWRKGPFSLFGIEIDAEWRSDLKWARVAAAGLRLQGARILDVGCGNGYYGWRMLGAGAESILGVDPTLSHVMQASVLSHYLPGASIDVLPLTLEALPSGQGDFDLVCSMGVLYHRRSPFDHLFDLKAHVRPGGSLVLETLIIDGARDQCLCPPGRYAGMRNLYFLPSADMLRDWLQRSGFEAVEFTDVTPTTLSEQRSTPWMPFHSLAEALDPEDPLRTVEGHPAPLRALVRARRPERRKR